MGFTWSIETRSRLVTIVGSGPADYGVSVETMRSIAVDPRYRPEFDVLVDVRKLDYVASLQEVRQFVDWMVKLVVFKGRMAIVVSDSLQFGAGRQFDFHSAVVCVFCEEPGPKGLALFVWGASAPLHFS